jgi:hypothetical protein
MNNFILISRTFTEVTPESSEQGDFSDSGFITEKEEVSFSELVSLMKEHNDCSSYPNYYNTDNWYSCHSFTSDYRTGTERTESIHFHRDNTINAAKYWKYARIAAD